MSEFVFHSHSATELTSAVKINGKAKGTFFVCLARKSTALNYRLVSHVQVALVWGHNSYYYRWGHRKHPRPTEAGESEERPDTVVGEPAGLPRSLRWGVGPSI